LRARLIKKKSMARVLGLFFSLQYLRVDNALSTI